MKLAIEQITTNQYNPNVMERGDLEKLKELIKREGNYPPLIVNHRDGKYYLIDGHQRLQVLKELGYTEVKVDIWEVDEETELMLLATINKLRGKMLRAKKKILYEKIKQRLPKEMIEQLSPENRNFLNEVFGIVDERKKRIMEEFEMKIQFIQRLTRAEYEFVMDYINKKYKGDNRERAIYLIIKEITDE